MNWPKLTKARQNAPLKNSLGANVPRSQVLGAPFKVKGGKFVSTDRQKMHRSTMKAGAKRLFRNYK